MSVRTEPDRNTHDDEQQALEEIRRLFARYRQTARHGVVAEHDEPAEAEPKASEDAAALSRR